MGDRRGPPAIVVREFDSSSGNGTYEVRISRTDGKMYCTCKGWQMNKDCKHLQAVTKQDILAALENTCRDGVLGI